MSADPAANTLELMLESQAFPCDDLRISKVVWRDAISQMFSLDLEVASLNRHTVSDAMAGADVSIVFLRDGEEVRRVHGMIAEVNDLLASEADFRTFRLRVTPRLFRLTLVEMLDIFMSGPGAGGLSTMGISVPEIIQSKLKLVELEPTTEMRLREPYPKSEFVVQYKETDLTFLRRLCEHVGISFFFEHRDGRDHVVFTDHAAGFPRIEGADQIAYRGRAGRDGVSHLEVKTTLVPHSYVMRDYNHQHPLLDLTSEPYRLANGFAGGVLEYGAHFKTKEEGDRLARIRAEERHAHERVFSGRSDVCTLTAGAKFTLTGHPDLGTIDLLVVEVEHEATQVVAGGAGQTPGYHNRFRAIPADRTYRPQRITPKPKIHGLLTGIIDAGPNGDTRVAQIDEQGRYRVRFIFDTIAPADRPASHPVRMAQNHVGENYGTHFPIKPGVEVVVGFIDGDPDRPIIVGAVPNPIMPSPVDIRSPTVHRIRTGAGIVIDLRDE
jgi:type VI secretion system secreted protein VgrG